MFFVINKEKLYAYFVSILTIIILFFMSHILGDDDAGLKDVSTNIEVENTQTNESNNTLETDIVPN